MRHYATVVRPEALYGAECLTLNKRMMMEELAIAERRILKNFQDQLKREINTEGGTIMDFINVLRKLQTLLEKDVLQFTYIDKI